MTPPSTTRHVPSSSAYRTPGSGRDNRGTLEATLAAAASLNQAIPPSERGPSEMPWSSSPLYDAGRLRRRRRPRSWSGDGAAAAADQNLSRGASKDTRAEVLGDLRSAEKRRLADLDLEGE